MFVAGFCSPTSKFRLFPGWVIRRFLSSFILFIDNELIANELNLFCNALNNTKKVVFLQPQSGGVAQLVRASDS